MKRLSAILLTVLLPALVLAGRTEAKRDDPWLKLDAVAEAAVAAKKVPGVVFIAGSHGKIVYRKAFGSRALEPQPVPMTVDTVFDLASLTKPIATTSCVMALVQDGKLRLRDPIAKFWPEFGANGKDKLTIRHLMTHTSGFPPGFPFESRFGDKGGPNVQDHTEQCMAALAALPLTNPPDSRFVYSDLNFITLGEVVRRVSGKRLDEFARERIFEPLGMRETGFNPQGALRERCAPTERRNGAFMQGDVHDPSSRQMAGVAGHAGLFSTADDLARFAWMLLSSDRKDSRRYPLSPETVREMSAPHSPPGLPVRGLGWDIDTGYSHVRGDLLPVGSFGHTGFTGTFIWVDPYSQSFIIGLSNRVHPDGKGDPLRMWADASDILAGITRPQLLLKREPVMERAPVLTGIDILERDGFKALQGRTLGLVTNRTGANRKGISTIDLLAKAPGVKLAALFSPEHGLRSDVDAPVASTTDERTGLPVFSLYGDGKNKPTPEQLKGLDTLVFDIQDVGVRYYTYISTLGLCMEAAAENKLRFVVLDRPNPINGKAVDGPLLDPGRRSFVGRYRLPVRHGMTIAELARMYNEEFGIHCDLQVVSMDGWHRRLWWDQTGLPWTDPSPNIRNPRQAELYCGIGLTEAANISVGRGTDTPFERLGAPWVDGDRLAQELTRRRIPGLAFTPVTFSPSTREYAGQKCGGVDIRLHNRAAFDGCRTALEIMSALQLLYPSQFKLGNSRALWGTDRIPEAILAGTPVDEIVQSYQDDIREFRRAREKYLLYR